MPLNSVTTWFESCSLSAQTWDWSLVKSCEAHNPQWNSRKWKKREEHDGNLLGPMFMCPIIGEGWNKGGQGWKENNCKLRTWRLQLAEIGLVQMAHTQGQDHKDK